LFFLTSSQTSESGTVAIYTHLKCQFNQPKSNPSCKRRYCSSVVTFHCIQIGWYTEEGRTEWITYKNVEWAVICVVIIKWI
jgi:hypothetical protein